MFFCNVVNVVIIVTVVSDYLVETALKGKPGLIDLVMGIVVVCHANQFYQLFFFLGAASLKLYGSKKAQIQ